MLRSSEEMLQPLPLKRAPFRYRVGIVGGGRVGGALAQAISPALAWIVVRSPWQRAALRDQLPATPIVGTLDEIVQLPDIVVLAVPDRAIAAVAAEIARRFSGELSGRVVVHLAGALLASELAAVESFGALVASAHPFTMIPSPHPSWLYGVVWGIEGSADALPAVEELVRQTGGIPYRLDAMTADRKALYHLSAVFASNVVTEVIRSAVEVAQAAGIPPALFLPPILRATIENASLAIASGEPIPRTGPVARADVETIERHLIALQREPGLQQQYCLLLSALAQAAGVELQLLPLLRRFCAK
jgi:predicted short-subunit dehydrogenase-like oxidoreductase (DUF2520 family)